MVELKPRQAAAIYVGSWVAAYLVYPEIGDETMPRTTWATLNAAVPALGYLFTTLSADYLEELPLPG